MVLFYFTLVAGTHDIDGGQENKNHRKRILLCFCFSFTEYKNSIKTNTPLTSSPLPLRLAGNSVSSIGFSTAFLAKVWILGVILSINAYFLLYYEIATMGRSEGTQKEWRSRQVLAGPGLGTLSRLGTCVSRQASDTENRPWILQKGRSCWWGNVKFLCGTPAMGHFCLSLVSLRWENQRPGKLAALASIKLQG